MQSPTWIVLAPGNIKKLEPTILEVAGEDPDEGCPWELIEGEKGYVAIIDEEPGPYGEGNEDLAKALSMKVKKSVYLVIPNDDNDSPSSIEAYAQGKSKGYLKTTVDDTLVTLGFRFDWMDGGKKVALRLEAPMVTAKAGEAMIWHWSVSQWQQMMRKDADWHVLLDGPGSKTIDQILGICADDDAKVRFLAASMLDVVGYYGLKMEERLAPALAALEKLAVDRSKKVREVAIEARDSIVQTGEKHAVRTEFPWMLNYDPKYLKEALALLDEDRPVVHRCIYSWLDQGIWNTKGLPDAAVAKLNQLAKTSSRAKTLLDKLAR